ncbi:mucin-5AC-like [Cyclopterus lumpus]|uniref:mucin-5AC-like n=1 Tax=Cyclopterus lumpus TaxID=8103 RepID=UPI001486BF95|nr:mucin-5AC-like [Cyclopterus lumpus]
MMIKLLSVVLFAGLFFALQATDEPNTTLPEDQALEATDEANTTLPEDEALEVTDEPNTTLPEDEALEATDDPDFPLTEDDALKATDQYNTTTPEAQARPCWTNWFDRDNPSGQGDYELLSSLRRQYPGQICPKPGAIQAQTLTGISAAAAGEKIYRSDTTTGFICRNRDQPDKRCKDYRVRFSCPSSYCGPNVCWTNWFDRDNPSGTGDWELLSSLRRQYPGQICPKPGAIQAQTLTGISAAAAGEKIYRSDTTTGFICRNRDQPDKRCKDYRVRFTCPSAYCGPNVCWTKWFDRDNPSGTGDWELLSSLRRQYPGQICPNPGAIEAQTLTGISVAAAGEKIYRNDISNGFICRNRDQRDKRCQDYRVRFTCPSAYCGVKVCWTKWFDRDNPSGSGDWELLSSLRKENPGKICPNPGAIEAQTLTGFSAAAAGERIYRSDTTTGFICRNRDQRDKRCQDYRVRFSCPSSFCSK